MPGLTFDTYAYVKKLRSVGVSEEQAEVQAEALAQLIDERLASKKDITDLKRDLMEMHASLQRDMKQLEMQLEVRLAESKSEIIKWVVGISAAQAALIVTLLKLIK